MSKLEDMTPEEAKKYMLEQQRRTRERQQRYRKRAQMDGRAKVAGFLSPKASLVLEDAKLMGYTVMEVLSEALVYYANNEFGAIRSPKPTPTVKQAPVKKTETKEGGAPPSPPPEDSILFGQQTIDRLVELHGKGHTRREIAGQMTEERWLTKSGRTEWTKSAVNTQLRQLK